MESSRPQLVILADAPSALGVLFGISLWNGCFGVVQRLGFREAIILSSSPEEVAAHLAKPSWARAEVALSFRSRNAGAALVGDVTTGADRILVVSAGFYYDARLLKAVAEQAATTLLIDSAPPTDCALLWNSEGHASACPGRAEARPSGAVALVAGDWLSRQDHSAALMDQLSSDAATGRIEVCDAAEQPTYVMALRKHVRPVFFPAPSQDLLAVAERFPRDVAQNGVLDFPGLLRLADRGLDRGAPLPHFHHAESGHVRHDADRPGRHGALRRRAIFGGGWRWPTRSKFSMAWMGSWPGRKSKRPRRGNGSTSSIIASSCHGGRRSRFIFYAENLSSAYWLLLLLVGSDLVDRLAKRAVKKKVGRNLDDVSNFDRFVRCIGGRRNINIWILIAALALGGPRDGFVLICWWGAATAAAHVVRALQIRW